MGLLGRLRDYVEWLISHPVAELSRAQRALRFAVDLTRHCSRELGEDQAGQMAAALTYRTIFSLVPLLMISMLAFRMFGDMDAAYLRLQQAVYGVFDYQVSNAAPEAMAFKAELDRQLIGIVRSVSGLSFEAIGGIGLLLLIWAALGLLISFEHAANQIYHAPRGRSILSRVVIYWSLVTLGPLVLVTATYLAQLAFDTAQGVPVLGPLLGVVARFHSLLASFVLLLLAYKLMPNTHVRFRPAAWGALVAAGLWSLSRWGFGLYVGKALPYMKIYGALGLIPLFLFWLYLTWLLVLFGMELAYTLQAMKGREFQHLEPRVPRSVSDPRWLVPMMTAIARGFASGQPKSRQDLTEELSLNLEAVADLADKLEEEGLVHQVRLRGTSDVALTLALPPESIPLARLVDLSARLSVGPRKRTGAGWGFLGTMQEAARGAAGDRTLASLIEPA
ncbi:MAG: YihY family inner membrane protein [Acidobacteria bacterium]|jgi:membrane protein|nr:YihY family inner membrane protein [Acidobacteriota bacterium]